MPLEHRREDPELRDEVSPVVNCWHGRRCSPEVRVSLVCWCAPVRDVEIRGGAVRLMSHDKLESKRRGSFTVLGFEAQRPARSTGALPATITLLGSRLDMCELASLARAGMTWLYVSSVIAIVE